MRAAKVRRLSHAEVADLEVCDSSNFLVPARDGTRRKDALVPARLRIPLDSETVRILKDMPDGMSTLLTV